MVVVSRWMLLEQCIPYAAWQLSASLTGSPLWLCGISSRLKDQMQNA